MRDDHHRHLFFGERADNAQHLAGQLRVKRARRLVKEQQLRLHAKRARDRRALLLPAGKLAGVGVGAIGKTHFPEQRHGFLAYLGDGALLHLHGRVHHVFQKREVGEKVIALEYETEIAADGVQLGFRRVNAVLRGIFSFINDVAAVGGLEQRCASEQRGFAAAGRPDDRRNAPRRDRKGDVFENALPVKAFADVAQFQCVHVRPSFSGSRRTPFRSAPWRRRQGC